MNAKKLVAARIGSAVVDLDYAKKKSAAGDKEETEKLKKAHEIKKNALKDQIDALNDKMTALETNNALKAVGQSVRIKAKTEAAKKLLKAADAEEAKQLKIKIQGWQDDEKNLIKDYVSTVAPKNAPNKDSEKATNAPDKSKEQSSDKKASEKPTANKTETPATDSEEKQSKEEQVKELKADLATAQKALKDANGQIKNEEQTLKGGVAPTRIAKIKSGIEASKKDAARAEQEISSFISQLKKLGVDVEAESKKRSDEFEADLKARNAAEKEAKSKSGKEDVASQAKDAQDKFDSQAKDSKDKFDADVQSANDKKKESDRADNKKIDPEVEKKFQEKFSKADSNIAKFKEAGNDKLAQEWKTWKDAQKQRYDSLKGNESALESFGYELDMALVEMDKQASASLNTNTEIHNSQTSLHEKIQSIKNQLETNPDFNRTNEARMEVENRIRKWEATVASMNEMNASAIESTINIDMAQLEKDIFALNTKKPTEQQSETVRLAMQEAAALGGMQKDPAAVADENVAKLDKTRALMKAAGLI